MMYLRRAIQRLRGSYTPGIGWDLFFLIVFGFLIPVPLIVLFILSYPPANADELMAAILIPFLSLSLTTVVLTASGFYYCWEFDGEQIVRRGRFGKIRQRILISEVVRVNLTPKDRYGHVALIIETKDQRAVILINKALREGLYYAGVHL